MLRGKECDLSRVVDWEPLEQAGVANGIKDIIRQRYFVDHIAFEYEEWEGIFQIQEQVYKELCVEFHCTYEMNEDVETATDKTFMTFRLGGQPRKMSMMELAACLGIYSREQLDAAHFSDYLMASEMIETEFYPKDVWHEFSSKPYARGGNSYKDMDNMQLRVIQRCLAHTISHRRENTERVGFADLWYLRKFVAEENINVPYAVAWYLHHNASGIRGSSPICGGQFVTKIAKSFNISFQGLERVMARPKTVGLVQFQGAQAISVVNNNYVPYQEPSEEQLAQQPRRRRHRQVEQGHQEEEAAYEQPEQGGFQQQGAALPSMLDLMQGIQGIQVSHNDFAQETRYEFAAQRYHNAWSAHNTQRLSEVVPNYRPTAYNYPPMWGQPGASYPPPVYDESAALAELQEEYRRQQEREQEERGFPYDYSPF